jgi:tungstate transport system ATP-binding protein
MVRPPNAAGRIAPIAPTAPDSAGSPAALKPALEAPLGAPLVNLRGAGVRLGTVTALHPLDLQLRRGESLALIGANGSGKTTLLRLLHGLAAHSGERIESPLQAEGRPARSAMVFQHPFLLNFSARWNVELGLWLAGQRGEAKRARALQALERVGLAKLAQRPALELSGGQQQRLALARAWALEPDILFLDEPTSSLDPGAKREVEALMAQFVQDGITLVMSTHNLGQAKRLATRVVYLEQGRLVADRAVDAFFLGSDLPLATQQFLKGELAWQT